MTNEIQDNQSTHSLCATDMRYGSEFTIEIGEYREQLANGGSTYGFINTNKLFLLEHPIKDPNQPAFQLFAMTFYEDREQLVQIGVIDQKDENGLYPIRHFELVLLPKDSKKSEKQSD